MTEPEPATRVTLSTIYNKLLEVEKIVLPLPDKVLDHEIRIRAIEKYLWIWIGASGIVGASAGQFITFIINK